MENSNSLATFNCDPNNLLDTLLKRLQLKNDAALSRILFVAPPVISKIRHRRLAIGAPLLISMHEISGIPIKELRSLMGDNEPRFKMGTQGIKYLKQE